MIILGSGLLIEEARVVKESTCLLLPRDIWQMVIF